MTRTPGGGFLMRSASTPQPGKQWYRIENSAASSTTEEKVATVYIYDEIGESWWGGISADTFVKDLAATDADRLVVHINSPGGQIFDGVAIHNAIEAHPAFVETHVDALAASAASFIAQAGDKRFINVNGTVMIHDGIGMAYGNEADMLKTASVLNRLSNTIAGIYARRSGVGDQTTWRDFMREEVWYNATEAVEAGLADEVVSLVDQEAEKASNRWDLTVFNHAGRSDAPSPREIVSKLTNRAKEKAVAQAPNMSEGQEQTPATPAAPETPEAPAGAGATGGGEPIPEGDGTPTPAESGGQVVEEESGTVEGGSAGGAVTPAPANKAGTVGVLINGVMTYDPKAIQAHVTALETAQNDLMVNARKNFVKQLAADNKISATEIESNTAFALDLSNAQYDSWSALMSAAQPSALFARHGGQPSTGGSPATQSTQFSDREEIENLEAIVEHNRRGGMTQGDLENTSSYKKLQALKNQEQKA